MGSILNNYEAVRDAIQLSSSKKDVLAVLGLRAAGGNYKALDLACQRHNLILPHYTPAGQLSNLHLTNRIPDDMVFIEHSTYSNGVGLKKRFLASGVPNVCSMEGCGQGPVWNGKPLMLQLDHINGIHDDNRTTNLRILCPHCHTQTETFCGRSNKRPIARSVSKPRASRFVIDWPSDVDLMEMLARSNYVQVGLVLGVSDNAIRKHLASNTSVSN